MRIIALCLVLSLAITGCGGATTEATPTVATSSTNPTAASDAQPTNTPAPVQATDTPAPAPGASGLAIGSTGESNGLKITLNEVRHESSGNIAPKEGNEYLIVNLTIENTTKKEKSVSSLLNFDVKDDTGQKYSIAFGAGAKSSADGSIAAGDKLRGESAFEVPKDAKGLVFIFDPVLGGDQLRFNLDK